MRLLYTLLLYLALPLILARLFWRSLRAPGYRRRWWQRLGFVPKRDSGRPAIWLHLVSVGETLAAIPLIQRLQQTYPDHEILITSTTPTGFERVQTAFGASVWHSYAPYDLPDALQRFLKRTHPKLAIFMETELWPNTIAACSDHGVAVVVANARLSERSALGYQKVSRVAADMMNGITAVAAQYAADGERFKMLGLDADALYLTGSIKFDIDITQTLWDQATELRQRWSPPAGVRNIVLAASTHDGEDSLLLRGFAKLLEQEPTTLLVLVPRHPERFDAVVNLAARDFSVQRHSSGAVIDASTQVVVGDTLGELMAMMGAADLVFMGGTWVDVGGHNFIEPAAWGKPVLSGHSLRNFAEVSRMLIDADGLKLVSTPQEFAHEALALLQDTETRGKMGSAAKQVADQNRGALDRLMMVLASHL